MFVKKNCVLFCLLTWVPTVAITQSFRATKEVSLSVDNDALLFSKKFDKYYSSGVYLTFRKLSAQNIFKTSRSGQRKAVKSILEYSLFHQMYTPENIYKDSPSDIDRPYAGWFGAAFSINTYFRNDGVLDLQGDLGLLGPATGTEYIQIWLHDTFNRRQPNGWDYQINNTVATHLKAQYQWRLAGGKKMELSGKTAACVGTILNNLRMGLNLRFGKLDPFTNSAWTGSKLGGINIPQDTTPGSKKKIFYGFTRTFMEVVLYNATIEGNIIGTPSTFTKETIPFVFHHETGFILSSKRLDYTISFVIRTTEVNGAKSHQYINLTLAHRWE